MLSSKSTRRKFVSDLSLTAAAVMATPYLSKAEGFFKTDESYTVGQIMDMFIKTVPGAPFPSTMDTLKAGSRDTVVAKIVTAMFPTVDVIRKTIDFGANFIICHEPTFYNHTDDVSWLQNDDVYLYKANLLKEHGIAVWRNHDYIHSLVPDGVMTGVVAQLGWAQYQKTPDTFVMDEGITVRKLIDHAKEKLNIQQVRYVGDLQQTCKNILLMPGAAGGMRQIGLIEKYKPDVMMCGEISEWETAEYVRDANAEGRKLSLIVLGHIASEEAGSEYMLNWVRANLPGVKAVHYSSGNSLMFA